MKGGYNNPQSVFAPVPQNMQEGIKSLQVPLTLSFPLILAKKSNLAPSPELE